MMCIKYNSTDIVQRIFFRRQLRVFLSGTDLQLHNNELPVAINS